MQANQRYISHEDYLKLDDEAPEHVRLEWYDGVIYLDGAPFDPDWGWQVALDMAGGTLTHARIKDGLARHLGNQLAQEGCDVLTSDLRTRYVPDRYVYPDVVVACNPVMEGSMLTNPLLAIEILSDSSIKRDTGTKMSSYMKIESLREYWIVWQSEVHLLRYFRSLAWGFRHYESLDEIIVSETLDIQIPMRDIYWKVFE